MYLVWSRTAPTVSLEEVDCFGDACVIADEIAVKDHSEARVFDLDDGMRLVAIFPAKQPKTMWRFGALIPEGEPNR